MATDVQNRVDPDTMGVIEAQGATAPPSGVDVFLERLAEKVGARASAATVYGTPIERDGVTVIPVARVRYGFGGGAGGSGQEGGSGGGGGVSAKPVGFVEIRNGVAEFRPIRVMDPEMLMALAPVILFSAWGAAILLRGLRRLIRS